MREIFRGRYAGWIVSSGLGVMAAVFMLAIPAVASTEYFRYQGAVQGMPHSVVLLSTTIKSGHATSIPYSAASGPQSFSLEFNGWDKCGGATQKFNHSIAVKSNSFSAQEVSSGPNYTFHLKATGTFTDHAKRITGFVRVYGDSNPYGNGYTHCDSGEYKWTAHEVAGG